MGSGLEEVFGAVFNPVPANDTRGIGVEKLNERGVIRNIQFPLHIVMSPESRLEFILSIVCLYSGANSMRVMCDKTKVPYVSLLAAVKRGKMTAVMVDRLSPYLDSLPYEWFVSPEKMKFDINQRAL